MRRFLSFVSGAGSVLVLTLADVKLLDETLHKAHGMFEDCVPVLFALKQRRFGTETETLQLQVELTQMTTPPLFNLAVLLLADAGLVFLLLRIRFRSGDDIVFSFFGVCAFSLSSVAFVFGRDARGWFRLGRLHSAGWRRNHL